MRETQIIWDDFPGGNVEHIAENEVTPEEVEEVLRDPKTKRAKNRSSNLPIVFGYTKAGRLIAVIFKDYGGNPHTIYPITAYEPDP